MPTNLALAAVVFVLAHRVISGSPLRARIVRRTGERGFQAGFSVLSLVLTTWLVWAYLDAGPAQRPDTSATLRALVLVVSLLSCYLIMAGLTTRNPTIAGLGEAARRDDAIHGVIRLTRHPFLVGVALLAGVHLLVLHAASDWIFFGTLMVVALSGIPSIDAKRAKVLGEDWQVFRQATSILPGVAALAGRQRLQWSDIGMLRPTLGVLLFALGGLLHLL